MVRIPTQRQPTHPGEMLLEEFLNSMGLTQRELAVAIHVPYQRVNDIVNGRRSVTPSTAIRLGKFFNMSADFWINLQVRWDMYFAQQDEMSVLKTIQPLHTAQQIFHTTKTPSLIGRRRFCSFVRIAKPPDSDTYS